MKRSIAYCYFIELEFAKDNRKSLLKNTDWMDRVLQLEDYSKISGSAIFMENLPVFCG